MDDALAIESLVAVAAVALVAPVVVGLLPRLPVPQVVLLLAGGMLIGPQGLGLSSPGDVQVVADLGLGFVFLLAGYEVDLRLFGQDPGRRAVVGWFASLALALAVTGALADGGVVRAAALVGAGVLTVLVLPSLALVLDRPAADPAVAPLPDAEGDRTP